MKLYLKSMGERVGVSMMQRKGGYHKILLEENKCIILDRDFVEKRNEMILSNYMVLKIRIILEKK